MANKSNSIGTNMEAGNLKGCGTLYTRFDIKK